MHLKGSELLCWSLIYGFTQDGESTFFGSLEYLASAINITIPNTKAVLDRLIEKGFIEKVYVTTETGRGCRYKAVLLKQKEDITETVKGVFTETVKNNKCIDNKDIYTPLISPQGETPKESTSKNFKNQAQAQPIPPVPPAPLPFASKEFADAWAELCALKKWAKKPQSARDKALKKLARFPEYAALAAIEASIIGDYEGIFPEKYVNQPKSAPQPPKPKYVDIKDIM